MGIKEEGQAQTDILVEYIECQITAVNLLRSDKFTKSEMITAYLELIKMNKRIIEMFSKGQFSHLTVNKLIVKDHRESIKEHTEIINYLSKT